MPAFTCLKMNDRGEYVYAGMVLCDTPEHALGMIPGAVRVVNYEEWKAEQRATRAPRSPGLPPRRKR
jgi:hypothetical protein